MSEDICYHGGFDKCPFQHFRVQAWKREQSESQCMCLPGLPCKHHRTPWVAEGGEG